MIQLLPNAVVYMSDNHFHACQEASILVWFPIAHPNRGGFVVERLV